MKQGLSLRVSQHLALTPQLQQSIRLLQLSTLELSQEVEQMLDDNPFLERTAEEAAREEFGLDHAADAPVRDEESAAVSVMNGDFVPAPSPRRRNADVTGAGRSRAGDTADREPDWKAMARSTWCRTTASGAATRPRAPTTSATTSGPTLPSSRAARSRSSPSCTARR